MQFKTFLAGCLILPVLCTPVLASGESEVRASVSDRVDTATTEHPTISSDFWLCLDETPPNEPVGLIKVFSPLDSQRFDSKVFPQTGGATATPPKEEFVQVFSPQEQAPFFLLRDGWLWYRTAAEPIGEITESKAFPDLTKKQVPETISVEKDGICHTLRLASVRYREIDPLVVGSLDHGYTVSKPTPPPHKDISYTDDAGQAQTTTAALSSCDQVDGYSWRPVEIPIRYYHGPYRIYQLDDTFVPYLDEAPYWTALDQLVFKHLHLSTDSWRLTGSEWTTDWSYDRLTGLQVRHGILYGQMYAAYWVSTYQSDAGKTRYAADAVYSSEDTLSASLLAHYRRLPFKASTLMLAGSLLFLLLFVLAILYILKRRKKDAQHNPGDQG